VRDRVKLTRYGMDCYAYGLLAAGHVDLVIEAGLHPYDICAPIAVIEAAGGVVTDWEGGPAHGGGRVLAASSARCTPRRWRFWRARARDVAPDPGRGMRRHHGRRRGGASGHRYPDRERRDYRAWSRA
jgi:hypothetical protein